MNVAQVQFGCGTAAPSMNAYKRADYATALLGAGLLGIRNNAKPSHAESLLGNSTAMNCGKRFSANV